MSMEGRAAGWNPGNIKELMEESSAQIVKGNRRYSTLNYGNEGTHLFDNYLCTITTSILIFY